MNTKNCELTRRNIGRGLSDGDVDGSKFSIGGHSVDPRSEGGVGAEVGRRVVEADGGGRGLRGGAHDAAGAGEGEILGAAGRRVVATVHARQDAGGGDTGRDHVAQGAAGDSRHCDREWVGQKELHGTFD